MAPPRSLRIVFSCVYICILPYFSTNWSQVWLTWEVSPYFSTTRIFCAANISKVLVTLTQEPYPSREKNNHQHGCSIMILICLISLQSFGTTMSHYQSVMKSLVATITSEPGGSLKLFGISMNFLISSFCISERKKYPA